jgi:prevent-host-death family protein
MGSCNDHPSMIGPVEKQPTVAYSHISGIVKRGRMTAAKTSSSPTSDSWTVADAKARLSEVIERAQTDPQIITRHGKPSAVVVSAEEWARKTERRGTLAEFLLASPLRGADLDLERLRDQPRDLDL